MTARAVWATLVLVLVFLLAFGVSGMYYAADYARELQKQATLMDSIEVLNVKLADAEAQASFRLKGRRSGTSYGYVVPRSIMVDKFGRVAVSYSTPMPDSSWTTTYLKERSAQSAKRADSLTEPRGAR